MKPLVTPTMAGSRTYVGPAYYNSRQPVTPFQCENFLHLRTCNNFHDILGLQESMLGLLCQMCPKLLSNVFIIDNGPLFLVQLMERKVAPFQEIQGPLTMRRMWFFPLPCVLATISDNLLQEYFKFTSV